MGKRILVVAPESAQQICSVWWSCPVGFLGSALEGYIGFTAKHFVCGSSDDCEQCRMQFFNCVYNPTVKEFRERK